MYVSLIYSDSIFRHKILYKYTRATIHVYAILGHSFEF